MATDPISEGRKGALERMASPSPDDTGSELDPEGDGVSLADISDALTEFVEAGNIPPEAAADLAKARDLIDKHATREDETAEEAEEEAPAMDTDGE